MPPDTFRPRLGFKSAFLQTVLASSRIRTWGPNPMLVAARETVIETGDGIRLLGLYSPCPGARGLVVLIHGWEGGADSAYIRCSGRSLFKAGYAIFRLNLRDHGNSHHLNTGLFFASLIEEVFDAVVQAARLAKGLPVFLAGFSLGGNFALRIARRCFQTPIPDLAHAVAISPVLDPDRATSAIDASPMIRAYFLKKWRRSLRKKQALFPGRYDFSDILKLSSIREVTDRLLSRYSDFKTTGDYFARYTLLKDALRTLAVPATIITARDDPIIPPDDFSQLLLNRNTRLILHSHGGHSGFIEGPSLSSWIDAKMIELFSHAPEPAGC